MLARSSEVENSRESIDGAFETLELLVCSINEKGSQYDPMVLSSKSGYRRLRAVKWMNQIIELSKSSREIRDTSVQILDKFIYTYVQSRGDSSVDSVFYGLTAATALILATKLHDSRCGISKSSFPCFQPIKLVEFERLILKTIQFDINPCHSPTVLMQYMLKVHPVLADSRESLLAMAEGLLSGFLVSVHSSSFTPSTIALTTLLLAFTKLGIESTDWIKSLPRSCSSTDNEKINIDRCLSSYVALDKSIAETVALGELCDSPSPSGHSDLYCRGTSPSTNLANLSLSSPVTLSGRITDDFEPIDSRKSSSEPCQKMVKRPLVVRTKALLPDSKRQKAESIENSV